MIVCVCDLWSETFLLFCLLQDMMSQIRAEMERFRKELEEREEKREERFRKELEEREERFRKELEEREEKRDERIRQELEGHVRTTTEQLQQMRQDGRPRTNISTHFMEMEIGKAACRERVCKYV